MRTRACRDSISQRCADVTRSRTSRHVGRASMSNTNSRRDFLVQGAVGGACLLTFTLSGCETKLTPAQARAARVPFRTLDASDQKTVEALGETLVPGSSSAGLAQYLDHQLSGDAADSMLMIKYLGV